MAGQHLDQLLLVLGLQKIIDRTLRKGRKSLVGWCEHRERALSLKCFDKPGSLDRCDKRCMVFRVHRIFNDVLVLEHCGAANFGVRGISGNHADGKSCGQRQDANRNVVHRYSSLVTSKPRKVLLSVAAIGYP